MNHDDILLLNRHNLYDKKDSKSVSKYFFGCGGGLVEVWWGCQGEEGGAREQEETWGCLVVNYDDILLLNSDFGRCDCYLICQIFKYNSPKRIIFCVCIQILAFLHIFLVTILILTSLLATGLYTHGQFVG